MTKFIHISFFVFVICSTIACSHIDVPHTQLTKQELLNQRVNTYITARDNNDIETIYSLMSPSYQEKTSKTQFIQKYNIKFSHTVLKNVIFSKNNPNEAKTQLHSTLEIMGFTIQDYKQTVQWIYTKKQWYIEPKSLWEK
jgi:hypothetical protein